jgi:hypothetical protein
VGGEQARSRARRAARARRVSALRQKFGNPNFLLGFPNFYLEPIRNAQQYQRLAALQKFGFPRIRKDIFGGFGEYQRLAGQKKEKRCFRDCRLV